MISTENYAPSSSVTINFGFSTCFCRKVKFDLNFPSNRLESFDEGVEFAFRNLNMGTEWIPLAFYSTYSISIRNKIISVGEVVNDSFFGLRGYNIIYRTDSIQYSIELKICGKEIIENDAVLNFRWLQTVQSTADANVDETFLDNVQINISFPQHYVLLMDDFNGQENIR